MLFSRSNIQHQAFLDVRDKNKKKYKKHIFIQVDIQDNKDPSIETLHSTWKVSDLQAGCSYHIKGDWKQQYIRIKENFHIDILISNSPCTYNTFVAKENHYRPGVTHAKYIQRRELQMEWMENVYYLLTDDSFGYVISVILCENPRGYMDRVVTYEDEAIAYVEVHPWHFLDTKFFLEDDNRMKLTHWFSGGNKSAIETYSLDQLIKQTIPRADVHRDWVLDQPDSNARSEISPGMAFAIATLATDRLTHTEKVHYLNTDIQVIEFHRENVVRMPFSMCCTTLGKDAEGNFIYCNLPKGHNDGRSYAIAQCSLDCGVWNYEYNENDPSALGEDRWIVKPGEHSVIQTRKRDRKQVDRYVPCVECDVY